MPISTISGGIVTFGTPGPNPISRPPRTSRIGYGIRSGPDEDRAAPRPRRAGRGAGAPAGCRTRDHGCASVCRLRSVRRRQLSWRAAAGPSTTTSGGRSGSLPRRRFGRRGARSRAGARAPARSRSCRRSWPRARSACDEVSHSQVRGASARTRMGPSGHFPHVVGARGDAGRRPLRRPRKPAGARGSARRRRGVRPGSRRVRRRPRLGAAAARDARSPPPTETAVGRWG